MKKILYAIALACLLLIVTAVYTPPLYAQDACVRKAFLTKQYEDACRVGGQAAAKKAAKRFLSQAKRVDSSIRNCKSCHVNLKPRYELTANGLAKFRNAGGQ